MICEKGGYRMTVTVTGTGREDCIAQVNREYVVRRLHIDEPQNPKRVSLSKLELVKLIRHCGDANESLLEAKKYVEKVFPDL